MMPGSTEKNAAHRLLGWSISRAEISHPSNNLLSPLETGFDTIAEKGL